MASANAAPLSLRVRWLALVVLLVAELLILSIRFDTGTLLSGNQFVSAVANQMPLVPQLLAVVLTATLIFGGRQFAQAFSSASHSCRAAQNWWHWLLAHLALLVAFSWVTYWILETPGGGSGWAVAVWLLLGTGCLGAWIGAAVPPTNWKRLARSLAGPLAIGSVVGVCGWAAGQGAASAWQVLSFATLKSVSWMLSAVGLAIVQNPDQLILGTAEFAVHIAPECSGYEGMGLAIVFVSTYLWWCRQDHRFPQALLLLPISVALMFAANAVRLAGLIAIGHFGWPEFALGGFHSQAGWLAFNLVVLLMIVTVRAIPWFCREEARAEQSECQTESEAVPLLTPFITLMLAAIITGALQPGFDWLYPVRVLAVAAAFIILHRQFRRDLWAWTRDSVAVGAGIAVYVIWIVLEPPSASSQTDLFLTELQDQGTWVMAIWLCFRVVGSVVTVPLAEEFAFRGYLLRWLEGSVGQLAPQKISWMALILSSLAFGVMHPGRWLAGTIAGLLFGLVWYRRRKLMDAVVAHATANLLIAVQVLVTGRFDLWI